jgi:signal transduction histidine kinase/CheY-like chemotaxis protein
MAAKIVVVDDSRTQRSTIAMALERRGYEVIQGSDGLEALHLVHNENPDLLISDIVMPELTGYQVCRLLKNDPATEDLPIILLTTLEHQEHRFWGKEAGADSFVLKGADAAPLEKEVARLLAEKKRRTHGDRVARSSVPFARQTAHSRLTDLLDRLLFDATITNRIRETGRTTGGLSEVLARFFEFFPSLIDYDACLVCARSPLGPQIFAHLAALTPAATLEKAKKIVLEKGVISGVENGKIEIRVLNPQRVAAQAAVGEHDLAMLCARFGYPQEGGVAVFTSNHGLYTEETSRTLHTAVREFEPILTAIFQNEALEKLKADFNAMIVHDLRAPLTSIMSGVAIIEDGLVGPVTDEQKTWLGKIESSSHKLLDLINDFLDLSKIEAGRLDLTKEEIRIADIARASLEDFAVLSREKKIALSCRVDGECRVVADRGRLGQVFSNLLSNALKFTPEGGAIEIGAHRNSAAELKLWVKDTGVGIPMAEMENLFDKYRQTQSGKSSKHKGTGLGLAICKMIVESHGGKIWAESAEGKGTTFFFTLPVNAAPPG